MASDQEVEWLYLLHEYFLPVPLQKGCEHGRAGSRDPRNRRSIQPGGSGRGNWKCLANDAFPKLAHPIAVAALRVGRVEKVAEPMLRSLAEERVSVAIQVEEG